MRRTVLLTCCLLLAGCGSQGGDDAAPGAEASYGDKDMIELQPLGLVVPAQGGDEVMELPFGSLREATETTLADVLGKETRHARNDECPSGPLEVTEYAGMALYFDEGEDWRSPPMAVRLAEDRWHISGHYAPQRINTNRNRKRSFSKTLGAVRKGAWTDWVFHIRWDYREKADGGRVEVWQQVDGEGYEKVIDYTGPIGYNDARGVYLKWGIYKYPWKREKGNQSPRVHFYDEIKIGDAGATFEDMKVSD